MGIKKNPEVIVTDKPHSELSCSSSSRWLTCTGSAALIRKLPKQPRKSSRFAAEGTAAHELCDMTLRDNKDAFDFIGEPIVADGFTFIVDTEMAEAVNVYFNYIRDFILEAELAADIVVTCESEVYTPLDSLGIPGMEGGTTDCRLVSKEHEFIEIVDYKHGKGISVEVEDNTQLRMYALGSLIELDIRPNLDLPWGVTLTIVQPRAFHAMGGVRSTTMTSNELWDWAYEILIPKAKEASGEDGVLVPDDKACRWCEASPCVAVVSKVQEVAMIDFEDMAIADSQEAEEIIPKIGVLTREQKLAIVTHANMIRTFITAVEAQVNFEMNNGSSEYSSHLKLVEKKTNRAFSDFAFDPVASVLFDHLDESELFVKKPRGITDIEKSLKKKLRLKLKPKEANFEVTMIMGEVTSKPEPDVVVALITDKRRTALPNAERDFAHIDID